MGHCISVYLINKSELLDEKIDSVIGDKNPTSDIVWTELKAGILATKHIPNIRDYGKGKTIAKITTDYFGGNGHQTAKLFIDNKKVYDESDEHDWKTKPINSVLKMMGVQRSSEPGGYLDYSNMDEFDTIGLSSFRHDGDFK